MTQVTCGGQIECTEDSCRSTSLILEQGATFDFPFLFNAGPLYPIDSSTPGSGATIKLQNPHCFSVGDVVHVFHQPASGCNPTGVCARITAILDIYTMVLDSGFSTQTAGGSNGYVAAALDMTGMRLEGSIKTRPLNQAISTVGALASGFAGEDEVLICGMTDVNAGDIIDIPEVGISDAKVLAVFAASSSGATSSVSTVSSSSGMCGCNITPATTSVSLAQNCDCVLLKLDQLIQSTFIEAAGVKIKGNELVNLSFSFLNEDPECGFVWARINGLQTRDLPVSGYGDPCKDLAYKIGFYTIKIIRGFGNTVPSHYPIAEYDNDIRTVRTGETYLKPSFC